MDRSEFFAAVGEDSEAGSLLIERLTVFGAEIMEGGELLIASLAHEMYAAIPQKVSGFAVPWSMLTKDQKQFWHSAAERAVGLLQRRLWGDDEEVNPPEEDEA